MIAAARPGLLTASRHVSRLALVLLLVLGTGGGTAVAQGPTVPEIAVDYDVEPGDAAPGDPATIRGTVTIDPGEAGEEVSWAVTIASLEGFTIEDVGCTGIRATTCEATLNAADQFVLVSGTVQDLAAEEITAGFTLRGQLADEPVSDELAMTATSCATITATDALRGLPGSGVAPATPVVDLECDGTEGTIEIPLPAVTATAEPTEAPSATPTEEPTAEPTAEPTEAPTEAPTATPTEEPTEEPSFTPTEEPSPTPTEEPSPTEEPTEEPSPTPTEAPSPTPTEEPTATPTEEPTAEPSPTPTEEPTLTATAEPTELPTEVPTEDPTETPTGIPTEEPTEVPATEEPTAEATEAPTESPTQAPQPTPAEDDDAPGAGLWVGVGSLLVLAVAAGAVIYQRRKVTG